MFRKKMLRQSSFYSALDELKSQGISTLARFRQGGGGSFSGYLPGFSSGACAFTILDFFRAGTQNCVDEWVRHDRTTIRLTQHAARQQYLYMHREKCNTDPLFLATSTGQDEEENLGYFQRKFLSAPEDTAKTAEKLYEIFHTFLLLHGKDHMQINDQVLPLSTYAPCIELSFDVHDDDNHPVKHSMAFILEPPGNQHPPCLLFLDPNAGVIRIPLDRMSLETTLTNLVNHLYSDYLINNLQLDQRPQTWIQNVDPILDGTTKELEKNIHGRKLDEKNIPDTDYILLLKESRETSDLVEEESPGSEIAAIRSEEFSNFMQNPMDGDQTRSTKESSTGEKFKMFGSMNTDNKVDPTVIFYDFDPLMNLTKPITADVVNRKTLK